MMAQYGIWNSNYFIQVYYPGDNHCEAIPNQILGMR